MYTLWEAASFSAAAYGDPRQPHSRCHIDEHAVDVLDTAVPVLIALDVRNREHPQLLSVLPIFLFDEVGVETVVPRRTRCPLR